MRACMLPQMHKGVCSTGGVKVEFCEAIVKADTNQPTPVNPLVFQL